MILAIDLGSTSFKAAVFDAGLNRVGFGGCELVYRYGPGGVVELDAGQVVEAVRKAVAGAMAGTDPATLTAVAITSQAQTFTVTDADLRPLMPFVSWLDTRADSACRELQQDRAFQGFARHASFPQLSPALQLCQLRHLRNTQPDLLASDRRVLLLPSYVVALWTGVPACDDNLAAMSGLYCMALKRWWPAALQACGIEAGQLPALVEVGDVGARTTDAAAAFGLPPGLPVILAGNDQTSGAYGAGVHQRDCMLITLVTCQVAYRHTNTPPAERRAAVAGPYPGGGSYVMAVDVCGGNLINWAETVLAGCDTDQRFFAAAEAASPGCSGLVFELGVKADDNTWRHVAAGHTPGDFARSIIETLVWRMVRRVAELTGDCAAANVLVAGGGSKSALWTSLLSEALDRPLTRTAADPCTGAASMAGRRLVPSQ